MARGLPGGGFGGCTVNVVREEAAERFVETAVRGEYVQRRGLMADCFVCTPSDGAFALAERWCGDESVAAAESASAVQSVEA